MKELCKTCEKTYPECRPEYIEFGKDASVEKCSSYYKKSCEKFTSTFYTMAGYVHEIAIDKGWWDSERSDGEIIALMHSELSEALEGLRHGNLQSEHIPEFSEVEEELADVIIRIMDYSKRRGYRVGDAIVEKINFNSTRPYKHGKKF